MGNLESTLLRVCGSASKQKKSSTLEEEREEDNAFIERNRDKYFQRDDYNKILEKYPEFKDWMDQSTIISCKEKPKQKKIKWKQGEVIGLGSFGKVMMGLDLRTGCMMAVKQVHIGAVNTAAQQERIKALEVEIELLSQFSHKNIVRYYGSDRNKETFNIFLEYISGGTIASLLDKYGPFNENLIRVYTRQILEGLEYLHVRNTIHRDIKGANVLVDNSGVCKLTDFGTAKRISSIVESDSKYLPSIRGTVNWMAPEVIRQTTLGRFCDIWSVGCTVIEMATGKAPWSSLLKPGATCVSLLYQIAQAKSPPPIPKDLSNEALDFLKQCFKINPQERPNVTKLLNHKFITCIEPIYKQPEAIKPINETKILLSIKNINSFPNREEPYKTDSNGMKKSVSSQDIVKLDTDDENKTQETKSKPVLLLPQSKFAPNRKSSLQREDDQVSQQTESPKALDPSDIDLGSFKKTMNQTQTPIINSLKNKKEDAHPRVHSETRPFPEVKPRARPLGKHRKFLLGKPGYADLSEDESITGNSFLLGASPDALPDSTEDRGQQLSGNRTKNGSLFKVGVTAFPWPESLVEKEESDSKQNQKTGNHYRKGSRNSEEGRIITEKDQEESVTVEKSRSEVQNDLKLSKDNDERNDASDNSVHSSPELLAIKDILENEKDMTNKENINEELFGNRINIENNEKRKPLSNKKENHLGKVRSDNTSTNLNHQRPPVMSLRTVESDSRNVEESRGRLYKLPLREAETIREANKERRVFHSQDPQRINMFDGFNKR